MGGVRGYGRGGSGGVPGIVGNVDPGPHSDGGAEEADHLRGQRFFLHVEHLFMRALR